MYQVTKYPHGTFSWADNSSSDPERAKAFYMALFGWEKSEFPIGEGMTYTTFLLDGLGCAALSGMSPDEIQAGAPSQWNNFVTVDDVDSLVDTVTMNGGEVMYGPEDVFDAGRMMHLQDPTGALLNLWQPYGDIGARIVNTVGAMCWNELITNDVECAKAFYAALLGWDFYHDENHPEQYTHISNRGRANGGMLQLDEAKSFWLPHFHVADAESATSRVRELGGAIEIDMQVDKDGARWSIVADPAGAQFYLMQLAKADLWIE